MALGETTLKISPLIFMAAAADFMAVGTTPGVGVMVDYTDLTGDGVVLIGDGVMALDGADSDGVDSDGVMADSIILGIAFTMEDIMASITDLTTVTELQLIIIEAEEISAIPLDGHLVTGLIDPVFPIEVAIPDQKLLVDQAEREQQAETVL